MDVQIINCFKCHIYVYFFLYLTIPSNFSAQPQKYLEIFDCFNCKGMAGNYSGPTVKFLLMISKLGTNTKFIFIFSKSKIGST